MKYRPREFYKMLAEMPRKADDNLIEFIADSMLEALREEGYSVDIYGGELAIYQNGVKVQSIESVGAKGTFVFLPNDVLSDEDIVAAIKMLDDAPVPAKGRMWKDKKGEHDIPNKTTRKSPSPELTDEGYSQ